MWFCLICHMLYTIALYRWRNAFKKTHLRINLFRMEPVSNRWHLTCFINYASLRTGKKEPWHSISKSQLWKMFYSMVSSFSGISMDAQISKLYALMHRHCNWISSVFDVYFFFFIEIKWKKIGVFQVMPTFQEMPELLKCIHEKPPTLNSVLNS